MTDREWIERYAACHRECSYKRFIIEMLECERAERRGEVKRRREERKKWVAELRERELDKMERLWLDVQERPDYFPSGCLLKSSLVEVRIMVRQSSKKEEAL